MARVKWVSMKVAFRASLAGVGVLAMLAGLVAFERDAWACSYGVPYQPGTLRCEAAPSADGVHTSIADADFGVTDIDVERTNNPPSADGTFGCAAPGVLTLRLEWGDAEPSGCS